MMFTECSESLLDEVAGLTPLQFKMYMLAWKYNTNCFGYMGLCTLWQLKISGNIKLKDVSIVFDRLLEHGFFNTDVYYKLVENLTIMNDYIPGIYKDSWEAKRNDISYHGQ